MEAVKDLRRRIVRIEVPEEPDNEWEWATSLLYRCLADPRRAMTMPAAPDERQEYDEHNFNQRVAYYTSLQSFLTYSFGWTRHDKGLDWWKRQEFASLDDRLALIRATWHEDGTLLGFFAWTTTVEPELAVKPLARWARHQTCARWHLMARRDWSSSERYESRPGQVGATQCIWVGATTGVDHRAHTFTIGLTRKGLSG